MWKGVITDVCFMCSYDVFVNVLYALRYFYVLYLT